MGFGKHALSLAAAIGFLTLAPASARPLPDALPAEAAADTDAVSPPQAPAPFDARFSPAFATAPVIAAPEHLADFAAFRSCEVCPTMVVTPAGRFVMGSPAEDPYHRRDETPQVAVQVQRFAIGRFEVTFAEWDACVADRGCRHRPYDHGWGRGQRPAINVSWRDAQAYVSWLSRTTGRTYRLLSEAEWEYAARAGTTAPFADIADEASLCLAANHADRSVSYEWRNNACHDGTYEWTTTVGRYAANPFGVFDLFGNVYEWVEDCHRPTLEGRPADGRAVVFEGCEERVQRGGSWSSAAPRLRAADRSPLPDDVRADFAGFRVAMSLHDQRPR